MPALVSHVTIDFDELLEDSTVASCALRGVPSGVMEMAVDIPFVFVVGVLWTKKSWAHRAREVLDMELLVCRTCS